MQVSTAEVERRMARFEAACRQAGLKLTHQRTEIYRELAATGEHPDAEAVYRAVRQRIPTISLDTVYRTLWRLTDLGLINTLELPHERQRFDANTEPHHHFVCRQCGYTRDIHRSSFRRPSVPRAARRLGNVETMHVEFRGLCPKCAGSK